MAADFKRDLRDIAVELGELVHEKNAAYGDANTKVAKLLAILFPDEVPEEDYTSLLLITRVLDKICRESVNSDPENWRDIAGYGICGLALFEERKPEQAYTPGPPVSATIFLNGEKVPGFIGEVKFAGNKVAEVKHTHGPWCTDDCPYHDIEGLR